MAAHSQVADIVEENHSRGATRRVWLHQQASDENVGAAWLIHDCRTKPIVLLAKNFELVSGASWAEVGTATDNDASRFAGSVGIDNGDLPHFLRGVLGRLSMPVWMISR